MTSLRGIQQTSQLKKVQRILGCSRASLGSLSEAGRVFDADLLRGIIGELIGKLAPIRKNTRFDEIQGIITLVDGTLLSALPKIVEAMWRDDGHKAFKLHTHFELLEGVPAVDAARVSPRTSPPLSPTPSNLAGTSSPRDAGYRPTQTLC